MTHIIYGIQFNCYYSVWSVANPTSYANVFGGLTLLYNILYNVGFMYSDVKKMLTLSSAYPTYWNVEGGYVGDILMRFFYTNTKAA